MADTLYHIRSYKNYQGLGKFHQFSNSYYILSALALTDPKIRAAAQAFMNSERNITTTSVTFDRIVASYANAADVPSGANRFLRVPGKGATGNVVEDAGDDQLHELPSELCLVGQASTGSGGSGNHLYRGAVRAGMYKVVAGSPILIVSMDDQASAFKSGLIGQTDWTWVSHSKHKNGNVVNAPVTDFSFVGIESKQRTNNKKKKTAQTGTLANIMHYGGEVAQGIGALGAAYQLYKATQSGGAIGTVFTTVTEALEALGLEAPVIAAAGIV